MIDGRGAASRGGESLVPLRVGPSGRVDSAIQVRATLIVASLDALRGRSHFAAYLRKLPAELHAEVQSCVPGTWIEMALAVAHYRAADALGLSVDEQLLLGRFVADRTSSTILGTLVRLATTAGVTPWLALEYQAKLWRSLFLGGGAGVYRIGPKEARYEAHGIPDLASLAYVRNGVRGMFLGVGELFCKKMYVHEIPMLTAERVIGYRVSWV